MNRETKDMLIDLLKEVPEDTIVFNSTVGRKVSYKEMLEEIEQDTDFAKQYFSDIFRISRDMLIRQAKKN